MPKDLQKGLGRILGKGKVAADPANRLLYSHDMAIATFLERRLGYPPSLPEVICWPESTQEVSQVLKFAFQNSIPVTPYGGGSGVSGGAIPLGGGILLDLKRMNKVEEIGKMTARPYPRFSAKVQSGILGDVLERELNGAGWTLGHFPASLSLATLGGFLSTRSAGQCSSRYGKIEEMVEEIEAVLPSGEVVSLGGEMETFPNIRPKDLFVGAEGTLGVITRAKLKIHPLPPTSRYRGVSFNRLGAGLNAIREIMQSGLRPSVIRLYDPLDSLLLQFGQGSARPPISNRLKGLLSSLKKGALQTALLSPQLTQNLLGMLPTDCTLILGFEGEESLMERQEEMSLKICTHHIARDLGEGPGLHWVKHRYSTSFKMPKFLEQGFFIDTIEVAATWSLLTPLYEKMRAALQKRCLVLAHFSHAYPEGCSIYFTIIGHTGSAEKDYRAYRETWDEGMEACLDAGGTISHHHGIGLIKAPWLPRELDGGMSWFREIKRKLDPKGILNPGKMAL